MIHIARWRLDDGVLMCEVREGRLETLDVLFDRHHGRLFHFFLGLTRDRNHSEDLVQELFLRMLKYRQSFKPGSAFSPWMFSIARLQAGLDQAYVACALERHRLVKKEYPADLKALVGTFLPALPRDLMADAPLHYERVAGGYQLWSVGWDGKDDGGALGPDPQKQDTGDWTWVVR